MKSNYLIEALKKITFVQLIAIFAFFLCALFVVSLPYSCTFSKYGISNSTTVWGEYGSYISGITSVLNLIAFIILTVYISKLNDSNSERQLEIQKNQLKLDRIILVAQFKQSELLKYSDELKNTFISYNKDDLIQFTRSLIIFQFTTWNLILAKSNMFPILLRPDMKNDVLDYAYDIKKYCGELAKFKSYDEYLEVNDFQSLNEIIANVKAKGEDIIRRLQDSILVELDQ